MLIQCISSKALHRETRNLYGNMGETRKFRNKIAKFRGGFQKIAVLFEESSDSSAFSTTTPPDSSALH